MLNYSIEEKPPQGNCAATGSSHHAEEGSGGTPYVELHTRFLREAEKVKVAAAEDLSQSVIAMASHGAMYSPSVGQKSRQQIPGALPRGRRRHRDTRLGDGPRSRLRCSFLTGMAPRADSAIVAEATPMSRPPETVRRLEAVETLNVDPRRFSFEIPWIAAS